MWYPYLRFDPYATNVCMYASNFLLLRSTLPDPQGDRTGTNEPHYRSGEGGSEAFTVWINVRFPLYICTGEGPAFGMRHLQNIAMRDNQESVTTGQTDRQTYSWQSDPYMLLCFTGDTCRPKICVSILVLCVEIHLYTTVCWNTFVHSHTSWVAVVTPTDRPKSVRNRCVIELFCGVVFIVSLPFWHFRWCRGFRHRTESVLFLFLLYCSALTYKPMHAALLSKLYLVSRFSKPLKNYILSHLKNKFI